MKKVRKPLVIGWWASLTVGGAVGAICLGPWIIPPLGTKQEPFRAMLEAGVELLRVALVAGAVLSVLSLLFWRRGVAVPHGRQVREPSRSYARAVALILLLTVSALAVPRLSTSLWWDELSTIISVVRRGPVVIMAYSNGANNHILNSLLAWLSIRTLGEMEVVLHLIPFFLLVATVQLLFWTLLPAAGTRVAFISGLASAVHPWLIIHGVEARGYMGAILFSWAAVSAFAHLLTDGSRRLTILYIGSCALAFGFVSTTIMVPFAHGVFACLLLLASYRWPGLVPYRRNAINLIFACLWVPVLALLLFGLPLPQTLAYARDGAAGDHLPLGAELGGQLLVYATGVQSAALAGLLASFACIGWGTALRKDAMRTPQLLMVSSLLPLGAAALYMLLPNTHASARFFCFLILPVCCGYGFALNRLMRMGTAGRVCAGLAAAGLLGLLAIEHHQLLRVNRPDLKGLAEELEGARVLLVGAQADVNVYYFPEADSYRAVEAVASDILSRADIVVEGRARKDNRLDEPDPAVVAVGFRLQKALPSAIDGTEYLVYRRVPIVESR